MAEDKRLFLDPASLGHVENARNAQRQPPSLPVDFEVGSGADVPYNSPRTGASIPGYIAVTGDFLWPRYAGLTFGGGMTPLTTAIPFKELTGGSNSQSAWTSSDVGDGINTDFADAANRTRYYRLGWVATKGVNSQGILPTVQPTGRPMDFGWDGVSAPLTLAFTQQTALQKNTITIADLSAGRPVVEGLPDAADWAIAVYVFLTQPNDAAAKRAQQGYFIAQVPSTGGTAVDGYSVDLLAERGLYYPSTFQSFPAMRAICAYKNLFVGVGGGESNQGPVVGTETWICQNDKRIYVRTGAANNILVLREDASSTVKPHDPRICTITNVVLSGGGRFATITVVNYHYFELDDYVFFDDIVGITGLNTAAFKVTTINSETSFTVDGDFPATGLPVTFTGAYVSGGQCSLNVFTWPDWVVGKFIFVNGQKFATVVRIVTDGGTNTGIEIDQPVGTAITTNASFHIAGKSSAFIGISDERGFTYCTEIPLEGSLNGYPEAVIAAPGINGVWIYSKSGGVALTNIPLGLGIVGPTAQTIIENVQVSDQLLSYGASGPNAVTLGSNGEPHGYSVELGMWKQSGVTQTPLDIQQKLLQFYRFFRFGENSRGDSTPCIGIAYNQNQNLLFGIIPGFSQFFMYDFRSDVLNICNIFGQLPMAIASTQLFSPICAHYGTAGGDFEGYFQDTDANVGTVTMVALQTGDILEFNDNYTTDYVLLLESDPDLSDQMRSLVSEVTANSVTANDIAPRIFAGESPTKGASVLMIVDTTKPDTSAPIDDVTYDGTGAVATVALFNDADSDYLTIGSKVYIEGVGGITGINGVTWTITGKPFPLVFEITATPGTFTGTYTDDTGTVIFSQFNDRIASFRPIYNSDGPVEFDPSTAWSAGAPLIGDIVQVNPILNRFESGDFELGKQSNMSFIDNIAMDDESTNGWAVQYRIIPSGNKWTPEEALATTTTYPGYATALGGTATLTPSQGGRRVRLRMQWLAPWGGKTQLNSLDIFADGDGKLKKYSVNYFPMENRRADRADLDVFGDLNTIRGDQRSTLTVRPGTRVLTCYVETRPVELINNPNSDTYVGATLVNDGVAVVRRCGGEPFLCLSTKSNRTAEGFFNGTILMFPILTNGGFTEAQPPTYGPYS